MTRGANTAGRPHDYMDGIRGILVLGVLFLHTFHLATIGKGPMPWYYWTALWFQPGMYTVGLFVVISGYCLMLPVAQSANASLSGGVYGYLRRRFLRIIPPYYVAAVLSLAHIALLTPLYARYRIPTNPWRPGVLLSHLFLFYNVKPDWRYQINSPYWSLALEWQLYILFPLLLVPVWRRFGVRWLLASTLLVTAGLIVAGDTARQMHPWFLLLFVSGMVGAVAANSKPFVVMFDRVDWARWACVLFGGFVLEWVAVAIFRPELFSLLPPPWQMYCVNETMLGLAILCSILHWNKVKRDRPRHEWPRVLQILNHGGVKWLGGFSFSLYLVHWPIIISIASFIRSLNLDPGWTLILTYLIAIPTSLSLGYVFFVSVERRFLPGHPTVVEVGQVVLPTAYSKGVESAYTAGRRPERLPRVSCRMR